MILVQLNKEGFQNDVHSLVKAFFPSEDVSIYIADEDQKTGIEIQLVMQLKNRYVLNKEGKRNEKDKVHLYLCVDYTEQQVVITLYSPKAETGDEWEKKCEKKFVINYNDHKTERNLLKQNLYSVIYAYTGRTLPWGTLTGVRPTKIPMSMLEEGKHAQDIADYMMHTYNTSKEKTDLSIDIASRELRLLQKLDYKNGYSLYVGIPFCPSTCLYCSFTSFPLSEWASRIDDYLDALEKELASTAKMFSDKYLKCIYIGGGTPTTLTPRQLERLLTYIESKFDFSNLAEYTVEAGRPDSITKEKLKVIQAHGITRISINPQTMKQHTLELIGRRHTVEQTRDSFCLARETGFDHINMDLIMGLPNETLSDVQNTMEELRRMEPDNITVHSLAVKRASRLNMDKEAYSGLQIVNTQEHLDVAAKVCAQMNMHPYYLYRQKNMAGNFENVGYAKEGKEGLYNILIMEEKQTIIACGAGSISKRVYPDGRIERSENVKDVSQYIERIGEMIERKRVLLED